MNAHEGLHERFYSTTPEYAPIPRLIRPFDRLHKKKCATRNLPSGPRTTLMIEDTYKSGG